MPRIFDNIDLNLLPALRATIEVAERSDFCVGYFNLRGWKSIDDLVEKWPGGTGHQCRLLVGMQRLAQDELREAFSVTGGGDQLDNQAALRLKKVGCRPPSSPSRSRLATNSFSRLSLRVKMNR